ncbi:hypothetical protein [Vitiosangium sp. GDMCC 1.1324]|uniref:hypothetical protein n=1 Tax=Vitiosangium sp. (strain GDMCC 1.1324) TaxID=2138576 RepID=UPI000D346C48|nr:hypothetical protein [Vitiosangium sp. GDMCC 1.1324]PTL84889.1 hypothetical protein DAT35_07505 [Vitiosangium sp. GDMCC 1.1324]
MLADDVPPPSASTAMHIRALLASALLLPACSAQKASLTPTPEPTSTSPAAPPTGLQREGGPFGTPHPFVFQAAARDGRWVVACQAREDTNGDGKLEVLYGMHGDTRGDELVPYLFLEPGAGERFEDFLTADPTGRYLVVVRDGSLRLFDSYKRTDTELAAPGAFPDSNAPGTALPVSFSPDGKRLLQVVLNGPDKKASAVLIHLEDGSRQEIPHGPDELGQAVLQPDGRWVKFGVLTQDSDGDGKLAWPQINTSLSPRRCRGPILSYSRYGITGDKPTFVLRRVNGGPIVPADDMLVLVGNFLLKRGAQGELSAEDASGQRTEWVPASCGARIIHVDTEHEQLLVACTAQGNALELHGARVHQSLGLSVEPPRREDLSGEPTRLYPVTPSAPAGGAPSPLKQTLVDLETRTLHPVPVPGEVHYTDGTRVLVVQSSETSQAKTLWFLDTATGEQRELGSLPPEGYGIEAAGNFVSILGVLVDLGTGRILGPVDESLEILDTQGRTLSAGNKMGRQAPLGPVQWIPAVKLAPAPAK